MKTAIVCLCLGVAAAGDAARPAVLRGQADYRIDVARPGAVAGQRYSMHQRVRVAIVNLNPFAGNYRVSVYERGYADSAITQFLAGIGVSVPASNPQPGPVASGKGLVSDVTRGIAGWRGEGRVPPTQCDAGCLARLRDLVQRFTALDSELGRLDSQDVIIRRDYEVMTSDTSTESTVVRSLKSVVDTLEKRAERFHASELFVARANRDSVTADSLWAKVLQCCSPSDTVYKIVAGIRAQVPALKRWASWRDVQQVRDTVALAALRAAQAQVGKLSTHRFEVGDYDYPTTVDIRVQRVPLGTFNYGVVIGQGTTAQPTPADTTFAAGWRTVASPRLHFGQRRRIGLSGALVYVTGPETQSYGIVYTAGDTARIAVTRSERAWVPLLTLTARVVDFDLCFLGTGAFNLHVGVTPSVTPRQTYFFGAGLAFADERIGVMVGLLSMPVVRLMPGFGVDSVLTAKQTSAPTQEGRVTRWAFGVNLRPF